MAILKVFNHPEKIPANPDWQRRIRDRRWRVLLGATQAAARCGGGEILLDTIAPSLSEAQFRIPDEEAEMFIDLLLQQDILSTLVRKGEKHERPSM